MSAADHFDAAWMDARLRELGRPLPAAPAVLASVDSTNSWLAAALAAGAAAPLACLADQQTAGRGRRGRRWASPAGCNVYLSVGLRAHAPLAELPAFALVAAAVAATVVEQLGIPAPAIKWPNDLLHDGRKLAGVLCESSMAGKRLVLVVGIGLNVRMRPEDAPGLVREWTSLEALAGGHIARGEVAARLVAGVCQAFQAFTVDGLQPWLAGLRARDCLAGQCVSYQDGAGRSQQGTAVGIADDGALRVRPPTGGPEVHLRGGEVSFLKNGTG